MSCGRVLAVGIDPLVQDGEFGGGDPSLPRRGLENMAQRALLIDEVALCSAAISFQAEYPPPQPGCRPAVKHVEAVSGTRVRGAACARCRRAVSRQW